MSLRVVGSVEERALGARTRSISFCGRGGNSPCLKTLYGTFSREPCWSGVECIGCSASGVLRCSAGRKVSGLQLAKKTFERVQFESVATLA